MQPAGTTRGTRLWPAGGGGRKGIEPWAGEANWRRGRNVREGKSVFFSLSFLFLASAMNRPVHCKPTSSPVDKTGQFDRLFWFEGVDGSQCLTSC